MDRSSSRSRRPSHRCPRVRRSRSSNRLPTLNGTGALLFLDNFEHLAPAAVHVARLLDRARTSTCWPRAALHSVSRPSTSLPLEPLSVDNAATLFVELAAARGVILQDDALASVREICRRLDGLPLAIELVAARLAFSLRPRSSGRSTRASRSRWRDLSTSRSASERCARRSTGATSPDGEPAELHGALAVFADGAALDDARALAPWPDGVPLGSRGAGRLEPRSERVDGRRSAALDARDRARARPRGRAPRERSTICAAGMRSASSRSPSRGERARGSGSGPLARPLEREFDNIRSALDWLLTSGRAEDALRAISRARALLAGARARGEARAMALPRPRLARRRSPDVRASAL